MSSQITATADLTNTRQVRALYKRICEEVLGVHPLKLPKKIRPKKISEITADDFVALVDFYAISTKVTVQYDKLEENHQRIARGQLGKRRSPTVLNRIEVVKVEDIDVMTVRD